MGYSTAIVHQARPDRWAVSLTVDLTRSETNQLFLAGDAMLSWPVDGLVAASEGSPMPERSGMFVSEIAAQPAGLVIHYAEQAAAERAVALLRVQLGQAGIEEGSTSG